MKLFRRRRKNAVPAKKPEHVDPLAWKPPPGLGAQLGEQLDLEPLKRALELYK